jgi:hypothetical protein
MGDDMGQEEGAGRTSGHRAARRVFRPRRARLVIYPMATVFVAAMVIGAFSLPTRGSMSFGTPDRFALVGMGLVVAYGLHRLADVRAVARPEGLEVVNIVHHTLLDWAQVIDVRLTRDDPWVMLDLSDGETLAVMGIQKADGERGLDQARSLARLVAEHSRTERND